MTRIELYEGLHASSELDLLKILPYKYEDLTLIKDKAVLLDGQIVCGCYEISYLKSNSMKRIIRFEGYNLIDNISHPFLIFNQMFYLNRLNNKKKVFIKGRYNKKLRCVIASMVFELSNMFVQNGLKPVYRLPSGISQSFFISEINRILKGEMMNYVQSPVPDEFVARHQLIPEPEAFKIVHQPPSKKMLSIGLRNFKYEQALSYCLKMEVTRRIRSIYKKTSLLKIDRSKMNQLVKTLPFRLTEDQIVACKEILGDMDSSSIMFRILQGDVGTGKTAVAFLSLYANFLRGGQGVFLAPTATLVQQHYDNALKFFQSFPELKIGSLISGMGKKEKDEVLTGLMDGKINILITTQAGFSKNITYKNLSLVVIDEQQQFGVDQRMEMISKGQSVDTLMMSATPIPRTLNRIIFGDLDLSELKQFPNALKRHVETRVVTSDSTFIAKAVKRALEIKRQVFVVAPRIDFKEEDGSDRKSAKEIYEEYKEKYGADKVQILHGKLKKTEQDEIFERFKTGEKPILISTSIVEVGVDVQNACLIVIYSANYFGLSALHQLRGRIGRNGQGALALFVYDGNDEQAKEKLDFLTTHDDGYEISQYDLKIRGAGTWSGTSQTGKDELSTINFSQDKKIFEAAIDDAKEIIDKANANPEFREYRDSIIADKALDRILA